MLYSLGEGITHAYIYSGTLQWRELPTIPPILASALNSRGHDFSQSAVVLDDMKIQPHTWFPHCVVHAYRRAANEVAH